MATPLWRLSERPTRVLCTPTGFSAPARTAATDRVRVTVSVGDSAHGACARAHCSSVVIRAYGGEHTVFRRDWSVGGAAASCGSIVDVACRVGAVVVVGTAISLGGTRPSAAGHRDCGIGARHHPDGRSWDRKRWRRIAR